ncbi:MAG: hypothetical protein C9356_14970 [Oleiphilus sp.]|nr:MAG: hypothetical protein C9356_14970 [Oleiphilus sp.]
MSCYCEEAGSYVLPVGEFKRLKKAFVVLWLKECKRMYLTALSAIEKANKASKKQIADALGDYRECTRVNYVRHLINATLDDLCTDFVIQHYVVEGAAGRLKKPLQSVLKQHQKRDLSGFSTSISGLEWQLGFSDQDCRIIWRVDNNNRSVDRARESFAGKWLFSVLGSVKWRGQTGGEVLYTDEYLTEYGPCDPDRRDVYGINAKRGRYF